jgi:hypothetical protein
MRLALVLSLTLLVSFLTPAHGSGTRAQKCAAAKLKAAGQKAAAKLKCHAKAAGSGAAVDTECLGEAEGKFSNAFAKAEAKGGCGTTAEVEAVEAEVDSLVQDIVGFTPTPPPAKCPAKALKAAAMLAAAELACESEAARTGNTVDPVCLSDAEAKFRAKLQTACGITADGTAIGATLASRLPLIVTPITGPACAGSYPTCGGACPTGEVCGPWTGGGKCICAPEHFTCSISSSPTCGGECPFPYECNHDTTKGYCICLFVDQNLCDGAHNPGGVCPTNDVACSDGRYCLLDQVTGDCYCGGYCTLLGAGPGGQCRTDDDCEPRPCAPAECWGGLGCGTELTCGRYSPHDSCACWPSFYFGNICCTRLDTRELCSSVIPPR